MKEKESKKRRVEKKYRGVRRGVFKFPGAIKFSDKQKWRKDFFIKNS
jgi:hypothetical protein